MDAYKIYVDNLEVVLTGLELKILFLMLENSGCLVTREMIIDKIWDASGKFVNDNTLSVYIKRIREKLKNDDLIKNIKIKKTLYGKFKIIIEENKILFYDNIKKKSITESGKEIDYYYKLSPVLVSDIQDKKLYNKLINKFKKVNNNTYQSISEIKYDPNDIDKERFLLSMNDGNYVYVTMSKFDNINNYLEIAKTLGAKNGILYLDYGNYFVPKE